jgi:Domain of unknown function (DUF4194)
MKKHKDFAAAAIELLKGTVFYEDSIWKELLIQQRLLREYFKQIGLEMILHEGDGYAFLIQPESDEDADTPALPRLIRKMPLSFEVSLLCILLREEMDSFDAGASESSHLFLSMGDIRDRLQIYFKDSYDQIRLYKELDRYIRQVEKIGLIRQNSRNKASQEPVFEVFPLIKSRVSPEFIEEFKRKLEKHGRSI